MAKTHVEVQPESTGPARHRTEWGVTLACRHVREAHPRGTGCVASVSPSRSDPTRTTRAAAPVGTAPRRHRALGQQFVSPGASRRRGVVEPRRVSVEHLASRGDSRGSRSPRRPREPAPPSADLRRLVACAMAPRRGRTQGGAWRRLGDLHSGRGFRGALGSCVVCLGFPAGDS